MAADVYGSISPAMWSFQLALRSRGLDSALTTIHLFFEREVGDLLGIPEDVMQGTLMVVGYTKVTDFKIANWPTPKTISSFETRRLDPGES